MMILLKATTARGARAEIASRWPGKDINYTGYDKDGEAVLMSLVRGETKGNVATAKRNRSLPPVSFKADVPGGEKFRAIPCPCGHPACKSWMVDPVAAIQGVSFTQEEAEAIAEFMNKRFT